MCQALIGHSILIAFVFLFKNFNAYWYRRDRVLMICAQGFDFQKKKNRRFS